MALTRTEALKKRHLRVRRKVSGTPERPRLAVHRSLKHLYAQVVDDVAGRTLCFATTNTKAAKAEGKSFSNIKGAKMLGADLARRAAAQGISAVVFDRGGSGYTGVIKAFADAAREAGLKF